MTAELPKQVQAQLEEAERIQKELAQPTGQEPDPAQAPVVEPEPAPEPPPQPAPAQVEPAQDAVYWQNRFKTLEGMYRAETSTLKSQVQQLSSAVEQVRQQQPPAPKEQPLVTSQDDDKFGSDLLDVMRRVVREENRALDKRLQFAEDYVRKLVPQVERVGRVEAEVAQTREERFWGELNLAVPDWEKVNADAKWHAWLAEYDPIAGRTRQESLNEGQTKLDSRRVIALFKLFKDGPGKTPEPRNKQPELARQVAPSRTSTVAVPPSQDRTYTGAEYAYWLDPRRMNDMPVERVVAMKAELERAYSEGRIKW
jgi:hypothetical protein